LRTFVVTITAALAVAVAALAAEPARPAARTPAARKVATPPAAVLDASGRGGFDAAAFRHDEDVSTPAGKKYESEFMRDFRSRYDEVLLGQCVESGIPTSFDLIVVVGRDGRVVDTAIRPETEVATCLAKAVENGKFAPPPSAPFHLRIRESFAP
jgi:hypothetical protein